jgi:transposase
MFLLKVYSELASLQAELIALRTLLQHRGQLLEHRSPHILHMQKALLQMNVQLSQAESDITGVTGLTLIRAILAGERDLQELAGMREPGCKKSAEEIGKALTGTWREEHLFILKQSLEMYDFYSRLIEACVRRSSGCMVRRGRIGNGGKSKP